MSTKLDRLTELAKEEPKRQFFSNRSLDHARGDVRGISKSTKGSQRRGGRRHIPGVPRGRREKDPRALSEAQGRKVPSPTAPQGLHSEGEREAETDLDTRSGGQDRAESDGGSNSRIHPVERVQMTRFTSSSDTRVWM